MLQITRFHEPIPLQHQRLCLRKVAIKRPFQPVGAAPPFLRVLELAFQDRHRAPQPSGTFPLLSQPFVQVIYLSNQADTMRGVGAIKEDDGGVVCQAGLREDYEGRRSKLAWCWVFSPPMYRGVSVSSWPSPENSFTKNNNYY